MTIEPSEAIEAENNFYSFLRPENLQNSSGKKKIYHIVTVPVLVVYPAKNSFQKEI